MISTQIKFIYGTHLGHGYIYSNLEARDRMIDLNDGKTLYKISGYFQNKDMAAEFSKNFPKYCLSKVGEVCGSETDFTACISFNIEVNGVSRVTGEVNEAAEKRRKKTIQVFANLGYSN